MLKAITSFLFLERESFPDSYSGELNYQCNIVIVPASFVCIFAWLGYIPLDSVLYPDRPLIVHLRWGLTAAALAVFAMQFIPAFKKRSMLLLAALGFYLQTATGILTGMTGADPVYVAGYFFVLMIILIAPIKKTILWLMTSGSVSAFVVTGLLYGISFDTPKQKYTLNDFMAVVLFCMFFTYVLDRLRYNNWLKSQELKETRTVIEREKDQISAIMAEAKNLTGHVRETTGYLDTFSRNITSSVEKQSPVVRRTMDSSTSVIDSFRSINDSTERQVGLNDRGIVLIGRLREEFTETMTSSDSVQKDAAMTGDLADKCKLKLDSASEAITALRDESSRIAEISKTINEIADKTALLSLNASIESARAGEHGRGFSVVADEISKLADGSMSSAKEIGDIIQASVARIAEASDRILETSGILSEIIALMKDNRSFLDGLRDIIQKLGGNLKELMDYFDTSVRYTSMIDELTKKNADEIRTYQSMIKKIEEFHSELGAMSETLTGVSSAVSSEISRIEKTLALQEKR